jgi:diphthamide biosynthesis methyltransferase
MQSTDILTTVPAPFAGPAWDTYFFALRTLELAEASYTVYANLQTTSDSEARQLGQITKQAHETVVHARRAVIEARCAYALASDLENGQQA